MKFLLYILLISNLTSLVLLKKYSHQRQQQLVDGTTCNRVCVSGQSKTCYFELEIEGDHTMSRDCGDCPRNLTACYNKFCMPADGVPRAISIINKQLPGPLIRVCRGDRIVVDVYNRLPSDTATIHWHGLLQEGTQYNDGVPYVTQCPILPGAKFRYQYLADASGTFFYHSHSGLQRVDGVTGPLVINEPDANNSMRNLYDCDLDEHVILYFDWDHELAMSKYEGVLHWENGTNTPNSLLVNGLGRNQTYVNRNNQQIFTPTARFHVRKGLRYRFRLINSANLDCPILVSIDGHNLTVISSDGNDFEPVVVQSIMTLAGERYDFILNANQAGGVFWIKFQGHIQCGPKFNAVHQVAVLQYNNILNNDTYPAGHPTYTQTSRSGLQLNPLNDGSNVPTSVTLPQLKAKKPIENELKGTPTFVYYVPFDLRFIYNPEIRTADYPTPQINNISNKNLPFPLLSNRYSLTDSMLCNETSVSSQYCANNFCQCTYVVKIPLKSLVEIVLINIATIGDINHPFHLHGFKFRVVSFERLGVTTTLEQVKKLYNAGNIKRNLVNAPIKDTVNTPAGGYTIIRFRASNPGFWLFHCHVDHHVEEGMSMVFKVGENTQMPNAPINFPNCGDYLPPIIV